MLQRRAVVGLVAAALLAGCGSDASSSDASPEDLLAKAKSTLDATSSAHFVLTSEGSSGNDTTLIGGEGDVVRPNSFQGSLKVRLQGSSLELPVVSVGGTVYAKLPFTPAYSVIKPADFSFGDPGLLLDPDTGVSSLLAVAADAKFGDEKRVDGEVVREVTAKLPGDRVQQVLTSEDPSRPVPTTLSIAVDSGELLRVEMTGPFFSTEDSTFTLELSDFGADVDVTAPATS